MTRRKVQSAVQHFDVAALPRVRQVREIPRDQLVYVVHGSEREVQGVAQVSPRHCKLLNVVTGRLPHFVVYVQHCNPGHGLQTPRCSGIISAADFFHDNL